MAGVKHQGVCKWFNSKKGFGFITPTDGSPEVFVHQSAILASGFRSLAEKEPVEYELDQDDSQRSKAINVTGPQGAAVKGAPKPRPRYHVKKGAQADGADGGDASAAPAAAAPAGAAASSSAAPAAAGAAPHREPRQRKPKVAKAEAAPAAAAKE